LRQQVASVRPMCSRLIGAISCLPPLALFDSARKLLEIGAEPTDLLIMRHQNSSTPSLRARIAVAAKLAVTDTRVGPRYVQWVDLRGIWAKTEDDA
jgi:hypothetical protein